MKPNELRSVLETALHALNTTHGLVATDRPDLLPEDFKKDYTWRVDNTDALEEITLAIKQLGEEGKS